MASLPCRAQGQPTAPLPYPQVQPIPQPMPGYPPAYQGYPAYPGYTPYPTYTYQAPPTRLRYVEGMAPPAGYHFEENPNRGLVMSGLIVFLVPYTLSATIGLSSKNEADRWLLVPVVGPVADSNARSNNCGNSTAGQAFDCAVEPVVRTYLVIDTLMQATGAILFTMGYLFPKKEFVSNYLVGERKVPPLAWSIAPHFDHQGRIGVTVGGTIF